MIFRALKIKGVKNMAMIKCAECGKEFSDRADACPNCGCPIEYQAEKSIGGEYHAADKIAPSIIVEHLTIAKELETERYTLQMLVPQLQDKINRLGHGKKFQQPKNKSVKCYCISAAIAFVIFFSANMLFHLYLSNHPASDIALALHKIPFELYKFSIIGFIISFMISVIFGLLIGLIPFAVSRSLYSKAMSEYNATVNNDNQRVIKENEQKLQLENQLTFTKHNIDELTNSLNKLYSLDIIHPKYRNMITVIRLLEYFDSGRCTALTGTGGAYNKYEKEIRQDAIISKLDTAINCLYQIRDTQYMLYESLEDCLDELGAITTQNDKLISTNQDISQNSAIAAYNSKIAASNTDALVFIEAYKGANGL